MSGTDPKKKQFILDLRRELYGIQEDGTLGNEFSGYARNLKNAIEHLSEGLYSEDVHFILELIQNAEDNDYDTDSPELAFVLLDQDPTDSPESDGCLCIFNNELGFQENHIASISQIGESTKKHKIGYIGEKGIGFKSVFIVSAEPHIYSNGYQFKFKDDDPSLGLSYVVPYILDDIPDVVLENAAATAILLPLKPGKKSHIEAELLKIAPETILFLSKLSGLSISLQESDSHLDLIREEDGKEFTTLLVDGNLRDAFTSGYRMQYQTFYVPDDLTESRREGVVDREISIAFPLGDTSHKGRIFAFLPTEVESGLPFLVNADFLLSASRESIQIDRDWSLWIRDCISEPVFDGIVSMVQDDSIGALSYAYIPLESQLAALQEFFSPVCQDVCRLLSQEEIVRTDIGELALPSLTRRAKKVVRDLFPLGDRPSFFKSHYLVDEKAEKYAKQLKAIGVEEINVDDLFNCLSDEEWLLSRESAWFASLYRYLKNDKKLRKLNLKDDKIVPTEGGDVCSVNNAEVIFITTEDDLLISSLQDDDSKFPSVKFFSNEVYQELEKDPTLLQWVEETFDLKRFSVSAYIENTLTPWADRHAGDLGKQEFIALMGLICDHWGVLEEPAITAITKLLPVVLGDGKVVRREELEGNELTTPEKFDIKKGWQLVLQEEDDRKHLDILSNDYLLLFDGDSDSLNGLFDLLGATDCPNFKVHEYHRERHTYGLPEKYKGSPVVEYLNKYLGSTLEDSTVGTYLSTWLPPSWFMECSSLDVNRNKLALIKYLDSNKSSWKHKLRYEEYEPYWGYDSQLGCAAFEWFYRIPYRKFPVSCFLYYLRKMPWINTTKGLKKPGEIFVSKQSIKEMFGDRLAYLRDDLQDSVIELLEIKREITTETVLSLLKELSVDDEVDIKLIIKLYTYLHQNGREYQEEFRNNQLIYVPENMRWHKSTEVIWDDGSYVLGDLYGWLSPAYDKAELREFFIEDLDVPDKARTKEYADAWLSLPEMEKDTEGVEKALLQIYPPILKIIKTEEQLPSWYEEFADSVQVWTQRKVFDLPVNVFVRDDGDLARLFKDDVDFVWRPDRYTHGDLSELYESLDIALLSESVSVSLSGTTNEIDTELPTVFPDVAKLLICYMLRSEDPEVFEHNYNYGVLEKLLLTNQVGVNSLELVFSIEEYGISQNVERQNVFLDVDYFRLYVSSEADREDILDDLAEQLAKLIWSRGGFKKHIDTVRRILETDTDDRATKLRRKKEWSLPPDLRKKLQAIINSSPTIAVEEKMHGDQGEDELNTELPIETDQLESVESQEKDRGDSDVGDIGKDSIDGTTDKHVSTEGEPGGDHLSDGRSLGSHDFSKERFGSGAGAGIAAQPGAVTGAVRQSQGTSSGKSRSRSSGISQRIKQKNQSRIVSYVQPQDKDGCELEDEGGMTQADRERIGNLAEEFVLETEIRDGYIAKRMPTNNPGFDVESIDGDTGLVKYIEVKGIDGDWGMRGVGITPTQHTFLKEKEDQAWLYVVENVSSKELRQIYHIKNPIGQIGRYQIDIGWKTLDIGKVDQVPVTLQDLIEKLKELTDEFAGEIIDFCHDNKLTLPEVGYELAGENGAVEAELELAWADCHVGVCATGAPMMDDLAILDGWKLFSMEDVFDQKNILIDELSIPVCRE